MESPIAATNATQNLTRMGKTHYANRADTYTYIRKKHARMFPNVDRLTLKRTESN